MEHDERKLREKFSICPSDDKTSNGGGLTPSKKTLPAIGVFWDIENCQVPKMKSTIAVVQCIRKTFLDGYREAEFVCVCDANKENKKIIQELNEAQVTVVHVNATAKNAADDKLCQLMRRFCDVHGSGAAVVLISGDVNFATELSDIRYRNNMNVYVVHNGVASEALLACAHKHIPLRQLVANVPVKPNTKCQESPKPMELSVTNLPEMINKTKLTMKLSRISDNCGGKILNINGSHATVQFPNQDAANRARKRMDQEDVYGNKISVNFPANSEGKKSQTAKSKPSDVVQSSSGFVRAPQNKTPAMHFLPNPPLPATVPGTCNGVTKKPDLTFLAWNNLSSTYPTLEGNHVMGAVGDCRQNSDDGMLSLNGGGDAKMRTRAATDSSAGSLAVQGDIWSKWTTPKTDDMSSKDVWREPRVTREKSLEGARLIRGTHNSGHNSYFEPGGLTVDDRLPATSRPRSCSEATLKQYYAKQSFQQPINKPTGRRNTPSPWGMPQVSSSSSSVATLTARPASSASSVSPRFLQPATGRLSSEPPSFSASGGNGFQEALTATEPVELLITNLDQTIEAKEMKRLLLSIFRGYVMVLHVSVNMSPDGNLIAGIRVPSLQDAQYAISQLQRHRIGSKRIFINLSNQNHSTPLNVLRSQVLGLLMDVPERRLPLFKFRELFEGRYSHSIGTSELHRIPDVVSIQEHPSGRMVVLTHEYRNTPSPACSDGSREVQEILEMARCEIHCQNQNDGKGWAEKEQAAQLPNVDIGLRTMSSHIHSLLQSHADSIPLNSLPICYECEFGKLNVVDVGVPLEHLITCVPGVHIVKDPSGVRRLEWTKNKNSDQTELRVSPPLICSMSLFCREYVDLLRNQPSCRIAFTKFIPAYHHHFGRQCRVADYGYTRLLDLLEALVHVVQILGEGNRRLLTLTHRAQVKRFTADLLRILKAQQSKKIKLSEFATIYESTLEKPLEIFNYGVCQLEDMLDEISEGAITVSREEFETVISIQKREQTTLEVERTKQFSTEVTELLRHSPRCRMNFTKFIPAYHHHFGRQCRVLDYGFSRLIELFEAIPDTVDIKPAEEEDDDKILQLVQSLMMRVLTDQATHILKVSGRPFLTLERFLAAFIQLYGYTLCPEDLGAVEVREVLERIGHVITVVDRHCGPVVMAYERCHVIQLSFRICQILLPRRDGLLRMPEFCNEYRDKYGTAFVPEQITSDLAGVVMITGPRMSRIIQLVPLQMLAKDVAVLLNDRGGRLAVTEFPAAFFTTYGRPCSPAEYGFESLAELLRALPEDVIKVKGRNAKRRFLLLGKEASLYLPNGRTEASGSEVLLNQTKTIQEDLLGDLAPDGRLPAPTLRPLSVAIAPTHPYYTAQTETKLIRFESPLSNHGNQISDGRTSPANCNLHEKMYLVLQPTVRPPSPCFPPPSLVPPVPITWMYKPSSSLSSCSSPPVMPSKEIENGSPSTPTGARRSAFDELDSSENEMSTPPCVRELIAASSPESTPTHDSSSSSAIRYNRSHQQRPPRLAAQFSLAPLRNPTPTKSSSNAGY